jgi:hypothetical protein
LGEEVRREGFVALAGNCYEREDPLPFIPFVELLEVGLTKGPAAAREILGEQAAEMTRLLPELRPLFPDLPAPLNVSPEESRRQLFKAFFRVPDTSIRGTSNTSTSRGLAMG